jgi:hypothetical protein
MDAGVRTRQVGEELSFSHMTIWGVLHEQLPYRYQSRRGQHLIPTDFRAREKFCQSFVQ